MKKIEMDSRLGSLQSRVGKHFFLSQKSLPGSADGRLFQALFEAQCYPDRDQYPNLYGWYILMRQFSPATIARWVSESTKEEEDSTIKDFCAGLKASSLVAAEELLGSNGQPLEEAYALTLKPSGGVDDSLEILKRQLVEFKADKIQQQEGGWIRIQCRCTYDRFVILKAKVQKCVKYDNCSYKREKKVKPGMSTVKELAPLH